MARKNYSEEFRRQAVDLYESTPGATVLDTAHQCLEQVVEPGRLGQPQRWHQTG